MGKKNFLNDRYQSVLVNDSRSTFVPVISGVPQGSILGPVLFSIFINDITHDIKSSIKIFADDTKIYAPTADFDTLQSDLYKVFEWSTKWKLNFNILKCKCLHYGTGNPNYDYKLNPNSEEIIPTATEEKDLGVTFDDKLLFDKHISNVIGKANQAIAIMNRTLTRPSLATKLALYKSLVRPHLEYGNVIWSPQLKRQSVAIEKVQRSRETLQRRFTR